MAVGRGVTVEVDGSVLVEDGSTEEQIVFDSFEALLAEKFSVRWAGSADV